MKKPRNHLLDDLVPKDMILDLDRDFVQLWKKYVRDDRDGVGAVSGEKGSGKTTFCWNFAKLFHPKATMMDSICYVPTYENIVKQFDGLPQYSCLIIDEAAKGAYGRNWMSEANRALAQYYMTNRKFHNKMSLFAIPKFMKLDISIREMASFWVVVIERGIAALFMPDESEFAPDRFFFEENMAKVERLRMRPDYYSLAGQLECYSTLRGFSGFIGFDDWSDAEENEYLALSDKAREELAGVESDNPAADHWFEIAGSFARFAWRKFPEYSTKRMFEETNIAVKDLNNLTREFNIDRQVKSAKSVMVSEVGDADSFAPREVDKV